MDPEVRAALANQIQSFREKFARDPGPNDSLLFDPDSDTPQPMTSEQMDELSRVLNEAMGAAGVDPALIYAAQKTGRITTPSESAYDAFSPADKAEWDAAIQEYEALEKHSSKRPD